MTRVTIFGSWNKKTKSNLDFKDPSIEKAENSGRLEPTVETISPLWVPSNLLKNWNKRLVKTYPNTCE